MPSRILIDTSYLFALYNQDSLQHAAATLAMQTMVAIPIVPMVALTEAAFLFGRAGGVIGTARFLEQLLMPRIQLEPVTSETLRRAREILVAYADSRLDFVDCCIMALAEQLDITQVCTFDRRDFSIFRPRHCDYLELLP